MENLEELKETFEFLDDWTDRYQHLIEIGSKLPGLDDAYKNEETRVKGCQSQVWLIGEKRGDVMHYQADSDAFIVKGLVAVVMLIFQDQEPETILNTDHKTILADLGLDKHLSPGRSNGLFAMIERIRLLADAAI